jgi:stage III sporulation protein AH
MLLKKQTVWLLTMLSLVVVLSVYYLTTPEQKPTNMAATEEKEDKQTVSKDKVQKETSKKENKKGASVVTKAAGDDSFEALRMEITDSREKLREELTAVLANTELSAEERNNTLEKIEEISKMEQKEGILESLIGTMDYDAALVRIDGQNVNITVKANKPSKTAADDIIQLVSKEFDDFPNVAVEFQPKK